MLKTMRKTGNGQVQGQSVTIRVPNSPMVYGQASPGQLMNISERGILSLWASAATLDGMNGPSTRICEWCQGQRLSQGDGPNARGLSLFPGRLHQGLI